MPRDFRKAHESIVRYLDDGAIPQGPGTTDGESPEAKEYTDLILALCCFADFYQMDDLANRSLDALRTHEFRCGGTLVGRHFQIVYSNTTRSSKIRHYCAVATGSFLSKFEATAEIPKEIPHLFKQFPDFEHDVREAQATFPRDVLAFDPDFESHDNPFGPCEFHTHRPGDICHTKAREVYLDIAPTPRVIPPPGYVWFLKSQWILAPKDRPPLERVPPFGDYMCITHDGDQYHVLSTDFAQGADPLGQRNERVVDNIDMAPRAAAPSPPAEVRAEEAEVDLYSADDPPQPVTVQDNEVKSEDDHPVAFPAPKGHQHQTRAQLHRLQAESNRLRCPTCSKCFASGKALDAHFQKHPSHDNMNFQPPRQANEGQITSKEKKKENLTGKKKWCSLCNNRMPEASYPKHFEKCSRKKKPKVAKK